MAIRDFTSQRLFVEHDLAPDARLACDAQQANYLVTVLRLRPGDAVLVFNGRDGEWRAAVEEAVKKSCVLKVIERVRPQSAGPDVVYVFALLKRAKLETVVQKATELGVAKLQPVTTDHTQVGTVNQARLRANVIEAAEQCGVLRVPELLPLAKLTDVLSSWQTDRRLIFCDEGAEVINPLQVLQDVPRGPLGVLVGPEGGFSERERHAISKLPQAVPISLGPRIMRADTAAIAALALVNATLGDWQ